MRNQPYDAFEHLYRSLFSSGNDLFAMLTAYFDDSGTSPTDTVAAVGGYIASVAQWERFVIQWKSLLSEYDIGLMHRSELENFGGEFSRSRGWDAERRTKFVKRAQSIIHRNTYTAIGSAVIKADFEDIMPKPLKDFFGGPYGWCAHEILLLGSLWMDRANHNEPINWIFEAGTTGSHQLELLFQRIYKAPNARRLLRVKFDGWSFHNKELVPLQSADVVAYEIFKQVTNQILDGGKVNVRLSAIALFRENEKKYLKYWNRARLEQWLAAPRSKPLRDLIGRIMEGG